MNPIRLCFLILLSLGMYTTSFSQQFSLEQTKEILMSHNWLMTSYTTGYDVKNYATDEQKIVINFGKNGVMNVFDITSNSPLEPRDYVVTVDKIKYGQLVEDPKLDYTIEKGYDGYTLSLTNPDINSSNIFTYKSVDASNGQYKLPTNRSIIVGANRESYDGTPGDAPVIISKINNIIKQAIGNIRFYEEGDTKYIIEDTYFTTGDIGVNLVVTLKEGNEAPKSYKYEFDPKNIEEVTLVDMPQMSPVGILKIEFLEYDNVYQEVIKKKENLYAFYTNEVYLSYLKVDPKNYGRLKDLFMELKDLYKDKQIQRLSLLENFTDLGMEYWISGTGISQTFELNNIQFTSCTMRFQYDLVAIGTSGDTTGSFVTEVPLKDISSISLDKSKSRPNTILLHATKDGFRTFKEDDEGDFNLKAPVSQLPLFIDVSNSKTLERVLELLKTHCKECGGTNLKLKNL